MLVSLSLVLERGMTKLANFVPLAAIPLVIFVERATWASGSNLVSIRSSPRRQQHQNATQARANTAISNEFVRLRCRLRAIKCSIVTGSLLARLEDWGATLDAP